jgi:hypothetical protein
MLGRLEKDKLSESLLKVLLDETKQLITAFTVLYIQISVCSDFTKSVIKWEAKTGKERVKSKLASLQRKKEGGLREKSINLEKIKMAKDAQRRRLKKMERGKARNF